MKISKIISIFLILFASAWFCLCQEPLPKARLIDEYGKLNCESVSARMDNFMHDLMNDPSAMGYAVVYPGKGEFKDAQWQARRITGSIYWRKFDKTRLLVVRGEERDDLKIQYWLVPAGANKPEFREGSWPEPVRDSSKPFIFFTSGPGDYICPSNDEETYINFLAAHPDLRGHIVIFNRSRREGKEDAEYWLKTFTEDGRIGRNKFRIFFAKNKDFSDAEFWVVPVKKK